MPRSGNSSRFQLTRRRVHIRKQTVRVGAFNAYRRATRRRTISGGTALSFSATSLGTFGNIVTSSDGWTFWASALLIGQVIVAAVAYAIWLSTRDTAEDAAQQAIEVETFELDDEYTEITIDGSPPTAGEVRSFIESTASDFTRATEEAPNPTKREGPEPPELTAGS